MRQKRKAPLGASLLRPCVLIRGIPRQELHTEPVGAQGRLVEGHYSRGCAVQKDLQHISDLRHRGSTGDASDAGAGGPGPHRDPFRDGIPRWPGTIGRSPPEASRPHARTSKWRLGSNRLGGSGHLLARRLTAECGSTLVLTRGRRQLRFSNIFGSPTGTGAYEAGVEIRGTSQMIRRRIVAISKDCARSAIPTRPTIQPWSVPTTSVTD